jgi:zearalenone synthase (highly reducing iterative type I polyketide synthase)
MAATDSIHRRWNHVVKQSDLRLLSHFAFKEASQQAGIILARKPGAEETMDSSRTTSVILPPNPSNRLLDISNEILRHLSSIGLSAGNIVWPPDISTLAGKPLISLLELEKTMLGDISPSDFETLKSLVLQSSRLLWVSMGDDPVMGAAVGYLRTLKNENMNLQLRYLLVEDSPDRALKDLAKVITKVAFAAGVETEYAELGNNLCINRWIPDDRLSKIVRDTGAPVEPEQMALGEIRTNLKLVTGSLERPGSFYFTVDVDSSEELGAEELDIEVKAISLRYGIIPFSVPNDR